MAGSELPRRSSHSEVNLQGDWRKNGWRWRTRRRRTWFSSSWTTSCCSTTTSHCPTTTGARLLNSALWKPQSWISDSSWPDRYTFQNTKTEGSWSERRRIVPASMRRYARGCRFLLSNELEPAVCSWRQRMVVTRILLKSLFSSSYSSSQSVILFWQWIWIFCCCCRLCDLVFGQACWGGKLKWGLYQNSFLIWLKL